MILSHKHKFIYIKTRKTASSAIEAALSAVCGPNDVITPAAEGLMDARALPAAQNWRLENHPMVPKRPLWRRLLLRPERHYHESVGFYEHIPAWRVKAYVGDKIWNSYYKFTFDRNPWDRQVSWYMYKTKSKNSRPPFEHFLADKKRAMVCNYELYAVDGEIAMDFLGSYENLREGFGKVIKDIGFKEKIDLPKVNVTNIDGKRDYRNFYNPDTRTLVGRWYMDEIEAFGYEF